MHKANIGFVKNSLFVLTLAAVVFSVVLIGGVSAATDMTITSPTAGENIKGSYNIQWTFTGTPQGPVKIQYYDGSWHDLTQVTQGSTSYTWDTIIRPDGTNYQLYVYERDTTADDTSAIFTIDNNPPTSSANSPGAYQNTAIFDVPYTASDTTSGVEKVELFYRKDGGSWTSYGIFTSSPISFDSSTTGGDGDYDFYTVATDNAGNVESKAPVVEASTTVDTADPTTYDDAPSGWQTSTFTVTLTWDDPDPSSGEDWTKYCVDTDNTCTPDNTGKSIDFDEDGEFYLRYHSKDKAGNTQDIQSRFVQLDTTPPYSSNKVPTPDSYVNDATPTISLDISDDGSGVGAITMTVGGFSVSPTITPITNGFHVEYTPSTPFGDGIEVDVSVDADDNVGNSMVTTAWSFTVDLTPPTTTLTTNPATPDGLDGWFVTTPTITLDCDDSGGSGCSATYYKWDDGSYTEYTASFSALEGIHTLYYYSVDVATNNEDEQSQEFKVDTQAPSFTSVTSDKSYYKDSDTLTVTADLGENGLSVYGDFSDTMTTLYTEGTAESTWTLTQSKTGNSAVFLSANGGMSNYANVASYPNIAFASITSVSFFYKISDSAQEITNLCTTWPMYCRLGTSFTDGYFSPYVVLDLDTDGDQAADKWLISQQWAEDEITGTWIEWKMSDKGLAGSASENEAQWHDESFTGGWQSLSAFQLSYPTATVLKFKVALGLFDITQLQSAYIDDWSVNGILLVPDPFVTATYIGDNKYEMQYTISSVEGTHTIPVTATDAAGNSNTDDSSLSVTIDNTDPVADANGDYTADEGSSITFNGAGSSDNYGIASYEWDLDDDGEYGDATGVSPQLTWDDDYSGDIGLKVTDLAGNTDTDSTTVTVNNVEPVVEAGTDQATDEGTIIYLDPATFTDDGILDTHTAQIDWGDGTTEAGIVSEAGGSGSVSGSHTYADNGVYTVTVTVTDDDLDSASDTLTVTVSNVAPVVNAGPDQEVNEGEEVSFSGSFTDQGTGDTHTIEWDFGDGGSASGTLTPTYIYEDQGIYTVTLTVTDDDGGITSDTLTVTVNDVSPIADAGPDQEVNEGDTVIFDGSSSEEGDPSDPISLYTWDFGDGSTDSGDSLTAPTHVYADDGTYTVTLTVDDEDSSDSDTMTVTVNNVPPTVAVNSPNGGEVWNDVREITWTATDIGVDDLITIDIYYSADGGDWNLISSGEENDGIYSWDTETVPDGKNYLIKIVATDDDGGTSDDISDGVFTIDNSPPEITASSFYVEVGDPITILPTITDDNMVVSATLYYSIGGVDQTPMSDPDGEPWEWNIDPQSSHTTITYHIEAEDEAGNEGTSTTYTVTVYDFVLHVYDGWNQISVPKQPDADSVARILASGGVFQYDAVSDIWIYGEDLTSINLGVGYFIESDGEQWIGINYQDEGSVPPSVTDVDLEPGWNLVGYMCTQSGEADEVIPSQLLDEISVVYWYDTGVSSYDLIYATGHSEEMEPGKGYWVHIPKFYSGEKLYYINICM